MVSVPSDFLIECNTASCTVHNMDCRYARLQMSYFVKMTTVDT